MARMHVDEIEIDASLVSGLLREQFPEWATLALTRVQPGGTDHAVFRLGDALSVRLARRRGPTAPGGRESEWLPRLAPALPVAVPVPVALGHPGAGYPWFWEIHRWVPGETLAIGAVSEGDAVADLTALITALQRVDPRGAPAGRGIPLADRDAGTRDWLARFHGDPRAGDAERAWERALAAPAWAGPPVWHHGDLDVRNWLVRGGRITGVIDWGLMGVGDPACDLMVAFKLHSPGARDAFIRALPADAASWERARGWAVSQAIAILAYYTPHSNPVLYGEADRWLALALEDR